MKSKKSSSSTSNLPTPRKGHFALYTQDGRRFVVPIAYLKSSILMKLLRMSEEEFGPPVGDRPIVLPCDAAFMEHVVASLRDAGIGPKS
ncbi:auxin-responsive protein SAUR36-like [Canna indica]|uniref:Auxin-responsive protein SAUR36-like n=1 Tax=Canna indica TaxID=4628 RepID=A0AAQ3QH07_9LILI|nr:auxin-responsive protein SAUR36-like [Canna indica]